MNFIANRRNQYLVFCALFIPPLILWGWVQFGYWLNFYPITRDFTYIPLALVIPLVVALITQLQHIGIIGKGLLILLYLPVSLAAAFFAGLITECINGNCL